MLQVCPRCLKLLRLSIRATLRTRPFRYRVGSIAVQSRSYASEYSNKIDLSQFPVENIRNFSIIAHIDHGKSTLADRLMEFTGTIPVSGSNKQVLDRLQVEKERGITVKAQTASLIYPYKGTEYLLNLVDTPGHVDFSYEVSRSLAACQGAVLLVDANQGVQAQTVANFYLAFEADLAIVPVLNKIDLPHAQPDLVKLQLQTAFEMDPDTVLQISAKTGIGIEEVLKAVVERVPCPKGNAANSLQALLFDSSYDKYRGVVAHIAVFNGVLRKGDKITSMNSKKTYDIQEIGILHPDEIPTGILYAGQVGYIIGNMREASEARVGDTYFHPGFPVAALPGFKPAKPMVFAGVFPSDQSEFGNLRSAIERLTLNDASVSIHPDSSPALGQGFRLGFLGLLHMDVFNQRLEQEHSTSVVVTAPNVPYKARVFGAKNIKKYGGSEVTVLNPCHLPDPVITEELLEPMVIATIITPDQYLGSITALCLERRGEMKDQTYIDNQRIMLRIKLPLNEILVDFFDELKSLSSGYASLDYEDYGYEVANLVRVDFLLNSKVVEELSLVAHTSRARLTAKQVCARLKGVIPRQLYAVTIQGLVGSKVIAREDIKPLRKDVLAKCYGGDITRKMKLLRRQAEGKKRMRMIGNIEIPKDAFINALKK